MRVDANNPNRAAKLQEVRNSIFIPVSWFIFLFQSSITSVIYTIWSSIKKIKKTRWTSLSRIILGIYSKERVDRCLWCRGMCSRPCTVLVHDESKCLNAWRPIRWIVIQYNAHWKNLKYRLVYRHYNIVERTHFINWNVWNQHEAERAEEWPFSPHVISNLYPAGFSFYTAGFSWMKC